MEPPVTNFERRGRKRRRKFEKNAPDVQEPGRQPKKRAIEIRGLTLVGRYVLKEFDENGVFLGKISSYDSGLYRVDYEDGDCEDLDSAEICQFLIADEYFDDELLERRKKLDKCLEKNRAKVDLSKNVDVGDVKGDVNRAELTPNGLPDKTQADGSGIDDDVDSYSNSFECAQDWDLQSQNEAAIVPPPELPPSSGTVGLSEDCVPYLFSVYGFLRSFSFTLFLSPFTLDDLVGCLNCPVPNTLLDAIHVALLRMVRRRLETLSSDGSELAMKCLRCIDWTLLDVLTWPVYIMHYLKIMKYTNGPEWTGFCSDVLDKDYCTLSVGRKLKVLQILCDDALETAEVRAEIEMREESEVGVASEEDPDFAPENGSGRVHQRYPRVSSSKDREARVTSSNPSTVHGGNHHSTSTADDVDRNSDECRLCGMDGMLLCCDGCPSAYHSRCIGVSKMFIPEGPWFCPECSISRLGPPVTVGTSLKGAEVFGSDANGQVFMGTCNHMVVLKISADTTGPLARYYNRPDIPTVLRALNSCTHHQVLYSGICQAILKYWEIPPEVMPPHDVQARIDLGHQKEEAAIASALYPSAENARVEDIGKVSMVNNMLGLSYENHLRKSGCDEIPISSLTKQTDLASVLSNSDAAARENFPYVANCGISENVIGDSSMVSASSITQNDVLSSLTQQAVTVGSSLKGYDSNTSGQSNSRSGVSLRIKLSCKKEGRSGVGTNDPIRAGCLYMGSSFKPHAYINHYVHGYFAASAAAYLAVFSSEENRASETHALDNPRKAISASISLQTKAFSSAAVRFFWPSTEKKLFEVPRERCGWCLSCQGAITSKKACLLNAAALNASRVATKIISGLRLTKNVESSLYSIAMYTLYLEESLRGLLVGPFQSANYRLQWRKKVELSSSCSEIKASLLEIEGSLRTISLSGDWTKLVDDWSVKPSIFLTTSAGSMQKRGPGRPSKKHICTAEITPDDSGENSNDFTWWHGRKQSKLIFQRGILPHAMLKKAARRGGKRKIIGLHYADISDIPKRNRQLVWRAAVEKSKNASHLALQVRYLDHHIRWGDLVRPEQTPQDSKGLETESSAFRNAFICDNRVADNKVMYGVVFGHQKHLPSRLMKSIIEKEETQDGKEKYWLLETRIPLYLIREYEQQQQLQTETAFSPPDNIPLYSLSSLQKKQLKASRKDLFSYLVRKRDNMGVCCFCASCQQDVLLKNTVKCNACEGYCHRECTMSSTVQSNEDIEYVINCKSCVHAKILAQNKNVESPTSPLALQGQEYQNGLSAAKSARQNHSGKQVLVVEASGSISNVDGLSVVRSGKKKHNGKQKPPIGTPESVSGVNVLSVSKKGKKNRNGKKMPSADSNLNSNKKKKLCSLGLIWKKNKNDPEEAGIEFRLKNILMKGNPDNMDVSTVYCRSCNKKEYDPCFMYIHCDNCNFWYHAMVVELEESKLPDLVGFKCCKCRRIRMPKCPLGEETGGDSGNFFELGKGVESFGSVSEQAESSIPTTPMTPIEDDVYIELDDPLLSSAKVEDFPDSTPEVNIEWNTPSMMGPLLSSVKVEDIPDSTPEVNIEWNAPSMMGPQKLPVRRQNMKHEKDFDGLAWNNISEAEPHLHVESKDFSEPVGNVLLSPHAEWDACTGAEDGMQFDYDQFNYEVSDFEPQTYFSFTELLADDGSQPVAVASENMPDVWDGFGGETSQSKYLDEFEMKVGQPSNDLMEVIVSDEPAFNILPCQICSHTEPAPELFCQNCGIHIHSHCSPWEELPQEGSWSCGNCRAWR